MSDFFTLHDIYRDLISEDTESNGIKFLPFLPLEIVKYKKLNLIIILRPLTLLAKYHVGDYVKTEWGRVYKIENEQLFALLGDWPRLQTLSTREIDELMKYGNSYKELTLVRIVKKDIQRFFYDLEFDETKNTKIELISIGIVDLNGKELYLINKDYDWTQANDWLKQNVYPYIKDAPDYLKVPKNVIKNKIILFIKPGPSKNTKLYGYYSAYDHVCLSQLFGTMNELPEDMPMYTIDLKQTLDYFNLTLDSLNIKNQIDLHNALSDAKFNLLLFKAIKEKFNPKYI